MELVAVLLIALGVAGFAWYELQRHKAEVSAAISDAEDRLKALEKAAFKVRPNSGGGNDPPDPH